MKNAMRRTLVAAAVAAATTMAGLIPATSASAADKPTPVATPSASPQPTAVPTAKPTPKPTSTAPTRTPRLSRAAAIRGLGPTVWRGPALVHPRGRAYYPQVTRWANMVLHVMEDQGIPRKYLPGILAQIQQESAGNPDAVNLWDYNARIGTPSKGLLQIIAPTYRTYAIPGYGSSYYQTVPYTNVWASLNYVKKRYGMQKFERWNRGMNWGY